MKKVEGVDFLCVFVTLCCDSDGIRTHDRLLRRQMLYPAELPDPAGVEALLRGKFTGFWRSVQIEICGLTEKYVTLRPIIAIF